MLISSTPSTTTPRARTVVTADGLRVKWNNVSYVKFIETDKANSLHILEFKWKYRVGIESKKITLNSEINLKTYFKQWRLIYIEDYFINLDKILYVEETTTYKSSPQTTVNFVFENGLTLLIKMDAKLWTNWKANFL